ncbi:MAG: tRNA glutamyl-Q(34) synthetase GluQRS [Betaproteobacteria bacterium]|nr:tRNA glutamyl-Q(34) synthetase GluQRS [Betaproteobacteria bacterium]
MDANPRYRGRFAPSPSGSLHFGSLVTALGSFLEAKSQGGQWLVRMEDLDTARNQPGADSDILRCLEGFGLEWDGPVVRQSLRLAHYHAALDTLLRNGLAYPCGCSRRETRHYSGTCREGLPPGKIARSFRFKTNALEIAFNDRLYGLIRQRLDQETGDFVICRADGPIAYQLAVVVDDAEQGISDVVRGADLLDSTPRQIALQRALGYPTPRYFHLPLVRNAQGVKLSKQTRASAVTPEPGTLRTALRFLGQPAVPPEVGDDLHKIIEYAVQHYDYKLITRSI